MLAATDVGQNIAFGVIALIMMMAAVQVVTSTNVVRAALSLVIVLAGVAAQYILLAAEFTAIVQVMVYIGAVVVLFLFGIMLTRARIGHDSDLDHSNKIPAFLVSFALFLLLIALLRGAFGRQEINIAAPSNTGEIGDAIFSTFLVPFEVASVLLLAALVGAIVLGEEGLMVLNWFLFLAAVLFCTGVYGVLARKNGVLVLMSIELILNAVNLNLVAFGAFNQTITGQIFALFVIAIAAAEVGVGLAIVLLIYRNRQSVDLTGIDSMKG